MTQNMRHVSPGVLAGLEFLKVKARGTSAILSALQIYYEMWPMVRGAKNNYFLAAVLNCHKAVALGL